MRKYSTGINISDFDAVRLAVASSVDILDWSHGEVTKPETINYRTQKPERDGLFCERIFGPVKDINPHDAKFKGVRSREAAVDKKGEVVTKSIVRRERMGHINLAAPVAHIWFLRGTPSAIGLLLGMTVKNLERIAYFASYVMTKVDAEGRDRMLADKEAEFAAAKEAIKARYEAEAKEEGANIKELAKMQTKELEELELDYARVKEQLQSFEQRGLISETDYRNLPDDLADLIKVEMGGNALEALLKDVDLLELIASLQIEVEEAKGQRRKKLMKRLRLLESMERAGIKPTSMCLTVLPVIPPDLRPMVQLTGGRFATSDLNDLYRRVINRNNRLKKLIDLNAPEVIKRNEQRMLQEAVDALIDNNSTRSGRAIASTGQRRRLKSLSDMLKGKQGRFRQNLLGKRVDYSGRSVIVAGPELNIDQCGLPKMMALELFKPFVIGWLIERDFAHNIRSATRMIELGEIAVWDALDDVIAGKYVLLNRAPSLHRLSIQAFQPVLIEGKAIQLHPLVCKGFNADFDGDQMAVHLPLSNEAQTEAREIMAANRNLLKPADGSPILNVEQDIVLGAYYLTYNRPGVSDQKPRHFSSVGEAIMARDNNQLTSQTPISIVFRGEKRETTLGRLLFNEIFPEDFTFQNNEMTKKRLQKVLADVYAKYGQEETARIADELKRVGFEFATRSGISMGMDDFKDVDGVQTILGDAEKKAKNISDQFDEGFITDEERYRLTVENWMKADATVQETLAAQFVLEDSSMSIAVNSGARGNIGQVKTAVGLLGVVTDATGKAIELPIRSNYKGGLTPLEYFTATRGARKGMIDTALKTADSGYLTRRLVDVSQDVFTTTEDIEDPGFAIYRSGAEYIGVTYASRLQGRYAAENIGTHVKKGELITDAISEAIDADETIDGAKIMSVLSVPATKGIPCKSYGLDPATRQLVNEYHPVGVIAAQSIGEPGTQLTLKTFHSGGVAGEDITTGLPRVEELFEVRTPKGQAYLSEVGGVASVWEEGEQYIVQIAPVELKVQELPYKDQVIRVASGSSVREGEVLASNVNGSGEILSPMAGVVDIAEGNKLIVSPGKQGAVRYEIPGYKQIVVKDGDTIKAGDRLTNGSINLNELMKYSGVEATQRYIMNEILSIFAAQGQNIADKHLEIIVRQMFSRVQIDEPGDSEFVTGDVVSKQTVIEANEQLVRDGKQLIRYNQLLLGITKASLATDSFLSAASFQDTTRVLIGAATSGKVDKLFGLKENVILGRKIPVGTGARRPVEDVEEDIVETEEEVAVEAAA
jgi:DNA-directed RNA polymerase subunit beta'